MLKLPKHKKRKRKQKRRITCLILLVLFVIISYFLFHSRSYEKRYQKNEFEILEKYNKELKGYFFEITKDNKTWHFVIDHSYMQKRKLINEIKMIEANNTYCIIPNIEKIQTYPQCIEEGKLIDYHLVSNELKEQMDSKYFEEKESINDNYEKLDLIYLNDKTFYIWNYKGFYTINKKKKENLILFDKDIYNIDNIVQIDNYLVIPDYQESYYFNQFYLINLKDGSKKTWKLKESIYFDGYYLGNYKKSLFYVDKKTKVEWELYPEKKKIRKIGTEQKDGKILVNGNWEKISLNKLINNRYQFTTNEIYNYEISDGFYVSYYGCNAKKKISNQKVKEIVKIDKNSVYYIVDESLYYYSESTGEILLMRYFEWNFNYKNMIFIY